MELAHPQSVSVHRRRYDRASMESFLALAVGMGAGPCLHWLRAGIEARAHDTGRRS